MRLDNISIALLLLLPQLTRADIDLEIMTSCEEISHLRESLRIESIPHQCRKSASPLENLILERAGELSNSLCILEEAPSPMLSDFTCIIDYKNLGRSIFCIKPTPTAEIYSYRENYKKQYSQKVTDYLSEISKCPASNGSATYAAPTNLPPLAAIISKFQFGYIAPLGTGRKTNEYIQQGYATIDKDLNTRNESIEYVHMLIDGSFPDKENYKTIGTWMLNIDHADDLNNALNQKFKGRSAPIRATGAYYTIKNQTIQRSNDWKLQKLDTLVDSISSTLQEEGFENKTEDALPPDRKEDVLKKIKGSLPPGLADISKQKISKNIQLLLNTTTQACTRNNGGAISLFIIPIEPNPEINSSFGTITLLAMPLGVVCQFKYNSKIHKLTDKSNR